MCGVVTCVGAACQLYLSVSVAPGGWGSSELGGPLLHTAVVIYFWNGVSASVPGAALTCQPGSVTTNDQCDSPHTVCLSNVNITQAVDDVLGAAVVDEALMLDMAVQLSVSGKQPTECDTQWPIGGVSALVTLLQFCPAESGITAQSMSSSTGDVDPALPSLSPLCSELPSPTPSPSCTPAVGTYRWLPSQKCADAPLYDCDITFSALQPAEGTAVSLALFQLLSNACVGTP